MSIKKVRLGEVVIVNPRFEPSANITDMSLVRFVPMAAVDEYRGEITEVLHRQFSEVRKGFTNFRSGDVLFAKITPCMQNGKAAVFEDNGLGVGFGSTEFYVLRPSHQVLGRYVYHLIRQESFRAKAMASFTGTGGQQRVPRQFIENYQIALPPLAEQSRVVDILNRASGIASMHREAARKADEVTAALMGKLFG